MAHDRSSIHGIREPELTGIGLSATSEAAAKLCRWRIEERQPAWASLGYLQVGLYSHESVPEALPSLLRETELPAVVHLLEINLMRPLARQRNRLELLLRRIERIEPLYVEEDMGLWCWGQTELEQHMLPPVFDDDTAAVVARGATEVQDAIGVPFLVENPPVYFALGPIDLLSFMQRVAEQARCGLVLDIGHLIGYCVATDRDPEEYLQSWTGIEHVRELHVAGYNLWPDGATPMWYDNHADPLSEYSLGLVELARRLAGRSLPITLEQEGATYGRIVSHIERVAGRFGD